MVPTSESLKHNIEYTEALQKEALLSRGCPCWSTGLCQPALQLSRSGHLRLTIGGCSEVGFGRHGDSKSLPLLLNGTKGFT